MSTRGETVATGSRIVYRNPWLSVREDAVRWPDGHEGPYSVVVKPDSALVIAQVDDRFCLVEQFRHPVGRRSWEFPQGSLPGAGPATPEDIARTELSEETGLRAGRLEIIGAIDEAAGFSDHVVHILVARDVTQHRARPEPTEGDLRVGWFAISEIESMVLSGVIRDAATIAALTVWRLWCKAGSSRA